jgi:hypothetical protein
MQISPICFNKNKTRLILSNGSERGDFVPMSYIQSKLGRIHDGIQLMKAYYPYDEVWSAKHKVSQVSRKDNVNYAWDYEYEDYHPFDIFEENSITLKEMEEIKKYGSDIYLTLTIDLSLPDNELIEIVKILNGYGRIFLRINHEANGEWFRYNVFNAYKEVSDFFVRFHRIIKGQSSSIYTVFSLTGDIFVPGKIVTDELLRLSESGLKEALQTADYWSVDKYSSLNYGWPFEDISNGKNLFFKQTVEEWWQMLEETYIKMIWLNDLKAKPLFLNEFNSDSDVDGFENQAKIINRIYDRLATGEYQWLAGITMYQFRDYGGLGLEKGSLKEYQSLPALDAYRNVIQKFNYDKLIDEKAWNRDDYLFTWGHADSLRGLCINMADTIWKEFVNLLDCPVYIVSHDQSRWILLDKNERMTNNGWESFYLFIPPVIVSGKCRPHNMIRNLKNKLKDMVL